jgi:hypothetical protein
MAAPSDPELHVLTGLRLKGFAESDVLAAATGLPADDVAKHLDAFEREGLVRHRDGRVSGWTLSADGRAEGERRLATELDDLGIRDAVRQAYRDFLAHNGRLLDICTQWQVRDLDGAPVVNDHHDRVYDAAVLSELREVDEAVRPVINALADLLERFGDYGPRLENALDRVAAGEIDWFTKPTIDSYHTVWFELHENLLATLGIERGRESEI